MKENTKSLNLRQQIETGVELEFLIDSLGDMVCMFDAEQRFTAVFGNRKGITAFSTDVMIGKYFRDVLGSGKDIDRGKFSEAAIEGKSAVYDWSAVFADNQEYFQISLSPMRVTSGGIIGVAGVIRNITKLKMAEIKFQEDYEIQSTINSIFQLSFQRIPLNTILERAIEFIMSMPYFSGQHAGCGIFTVEENTKMLVLSASKDLPNKIRESMSKISIEGHYFNRAFKTRTLQFIDSSETLDDRYRYLLQRRHYCIPLVSLEKTFGMVDIILKNDYVRNSRHEEYLTAVAASLSSVIMQKDTEKRLEENVSKSQIMTDRTIFMLSSIIEEKDPYIVGHQQRVGKLASNIAWELKLTDDQIHGLFISGLLHDIGKIVIPSEILLKPGKLREAELEIIKLHAQKGYDLLKNIDFPWPVARTAYQHHERLNGSGYPLKLAGRDIFIESRILAVADVVEAMSFDRPYHKGLKIDEILKELEKNKNVWYDEAVVDACVNLFLKKRFTWENV